MADKIQCSTHGEAWTTYVCSHLSGDSVALGFNREEPSAEKQFPDAWCDACEKIRTMHDGWNEQSEKLTKIKLLCSGCYERARIRNTITEVSLQDLAGFRWKCGNCEEWHSGPCLDFAYPEPYYWDDGLDPGNVVRGASPLAALPDTFLNEDFCAIKGADFFVRGIIRLPILGTTEHFCWGAWGSLSRENFERLLTLHDDPKRAELPPMFAWLSSKIPEYPDTLSLKMYAHVQAPGEVPYFELEPTDHPLPKEQHQGIGPERVREIMMKQVSEFERPS